jgi:predicted membrane protein
LEIKNVNLFFIGLVILIVGIFIVIFDYSQIQYFENFECNSYFLLEENSHQRLKIEFSIGVIFLVIGIVLCVFSLINKTEKKN